MKKSSIKIISLLVLMTMALSSCLKDLEDFTGQFSGSPVIAELSESPNAATGTVAREIIDPTLPAVFTLRVNIASPNPLGVATTVTLSLDNSLITAYNTAKGLTGAAAAIPVPANALTVASYDVTVPAGQREVDWSFTIDATKVPNSLAIMYLLPVKIASANNNITVSGNFGTKLVRILARNKYDGKYTVTGTFVDLAGNTAWLGLYPKHVNLITVSGDVVSKYDTDQSTFAYVFDTGDGLSSFGAWTPVFKFDASDNVIDVINTTADPAPRSRTAALNTAAGVVNKRNADKSIDVSYYLVQDNIVPKKRSLVTEHYTYVGPR